MARMIPNTVSADTKSPGERALFEYLRDSPLTKDWTVFHSLDVANHKVQVTGEVDFVVLIPGKGVLCVEVKSHTYIKRDAETGRWFFGHSDKSGSVRGPFKQVKTAMYSLASDLVSTYPALKTVPFGTCVVFSHCKFTVSSPEWHDWEVLDSNQFDSQIAAKLDGILDQWRQIYFTSPSSRNAFPDKDAPDPQQSDLLAKFFRPIFESYEPPKSRSKRNLAEVKKYTEEQFGALDFFELNERCIYSGPAGTGKTFLAIELARRLGNNGDRVLFLCFNRKLKVWLSKQLEGAGLKVKTFHQHLKEIVKGREPADNESQEYWKETLPNLALEVLSEEQGEPLFDSLVIDEMQDLMLSNYLDCLDLSIKGGLKEGRWAVFGDFERQAIYEHDLTLNDFRLQTQAPAYPLRVNCRNKPRVAEYVHTLGKLSPRYSSVRRPDDGSTPLIKMYSGEEDQRDLLIQVLSELRQQGFKGSNIVVLSPYSSPKSIASSIDILPWKNRLQEYRGDLSPNFIPYSTIHGFKGLEAETVVVTDISQSTANSDLFYVALTRSLDKLVILIDSGSAEQILQSTFGTYGAGHVSSHRK